MKRESNFLFRYGIALQLVALAFILSALSLYNYKVQRDLLLHQMQGDAADIVNAIVTSIERFRSIKGTMSLQKLVSDVSLELDIFEFRYIEPDGTIANSMIREEIGRKHNHNSFLAVYNDPDLMGDFFFEERDGERVMAGYHPVYFNDEMIGIIDLAVSVTGYDMAAVDKNEALVRRQIDLKNLINAIRGSIRNSLEIFNSIDLYAFLHGYVASAKNITQISIIDVTGSVVMSSNSEMIGAAIKAESLEAEQLVEIDGRLVYRTLTEEVPTKFSRSGRLLLMIDATPYAANERQLFITACVTSAAGVLFALLIAVSIYRFTVELTRRERAHLEQMVQERTAEIDMLSKTDGLTGLWNRRYWEEWGAVEFQRSREMGRDLSLLIIDLDHFKQVNDRYGHQAGDEVLRYAAKSIQATLRESDFIARYGGEEIVVVLPSISLANAREVADKICARLASVPVVFEEHEIDISGSIGLSHCRAGVESLEALVKEADAALYISKERGRNRVTVYDDLVTEESERLSNQM